MTRPVLGISALALLQLTLACAPPEQGSDASQAPGRDAATDASAPSDGAQSADSFTSGDAALALADHAVTVDAEADGTCTADSWVAAVQGRVVDEADQGVGGAMVQLCVRTGGPSGTLLCVRPESSDGVGLFTIQVPQAARCMVRATLRVLLPEQDRATSYCELDLVGADGVLALSAPMLLVETHPATALPPLGDTASARTVVFDDGLELDVVPQQFFGGSYDALAARRVDPAAVPLCFVDDPAAFEGLYAFSPEGDVQSATYDVRIPNPTDLPVGAAVDLFTLGGLGCHLTDGTTVPEGQWARFGTGTVRADGVIEASGADGLPCLSWLGYALAP